MRGTEAPLQSTPHLHFSWKEGDEKREREGKSEGEGERSSVCRFSLQLAERRALGK